MELRRSRVTTSVRTEGGLLPSDLLAKIAGVEADVPGLSDADFGLAPGQRFRETITRSWNRLVGAWAALEAVRVDAEPSDPLTTPTRERFLLPFFEELGFGRLTTARALDIEGTSYPISHGWNNRVPVHLVGSGVELDARTKGVRGAAGAAPHALVQEYLNRSDEALWGLVANGRTLRLLRDNTSLTRQAFVEFDLDAIFAGELFADFALLWTICHRTRFEGDRPANCLLEKWTRKAADDGTRALDKLRGGVEKAIETLGVGFLASRGNAALVDALRSGTLDPQDYYRELLRLVYRLIFLFTAEDRRDETTGRELLFDPAAPDDAVERYRRYYSTVRLRSIAGRRRGTRHPDMWLSLRHVMTALGDDGAASLALPALGSFLFGTEACPHLDQADLRNQDLLDAVRALATIEDDRRLRFVDYRNLGAEELGGIYEGLLELHPRIELDANPPRFVLGTAVGNERKATGSYYTPTSLINCLLDSALDPVITEAVEGRDAEAAEAAILSLAVVDPAAGSGHFVVAAAHRLAKRLAAIRTQEGEPPPSAVRLALRDVISHCIYAVDLNPMAVELCKVSLWLEALEPGKPLSFLDAHIKCGNSLLGAQPEALPDGIPDAAFDPMPDDAKPVARAWRDHNRRERQGQQSLFEAPIAIPTHELAALALELDAMPEASAASVAAKAIRHAEYSRSEDLARARDPLNAWCSAFLAQKTVGAVQITTATVRALARPDSLAMPARLAVNSLTAEYALFHWALEFPVVFERGGFNVVIGNPPFVNFIEGGIPSRWQRLMRQVPGAATLGRTADLAYHFLLRSASLVCEGGYVGLVQPRAVLTAEALKGFRSSPPRAPRMIYAPNKSDLFTGADVFVCLVALGPAGPCLVSRADDPGDAGWREVSIDDGRWWAAVSSDEAGGAADSLPGGPPLEKRFEIRSSMFVAEAYDLRAALVDDLDGSGPKLLTTGLIDPGASLWGIESCRYLKAKYQHPRLDETKIPDGGALARSLRHARRPKVIVAGLGKRVEAFVDTNGEYFGAVSTFSILHPEDDTAELSRLETYLNSPEVTQHFRSELGGNAMGGGSATMRRSFLAELPWPEGI